MTWIDDTEKHLADITKRDGQIRTDADVLFKGLWDELKANVADARRITRFASLETNGNPEARIIKMQVPGPVAMPREKSVRISLMKDEHRIVTNDGVVDVVIDIDVCDDGVTCLKINGSQASYAEVAIAILRPFLYPGIGPIPAPSSAT